MENQRKADPNAQTMAQPVVSRPAESSKPVSTASALAVDQKAIAGRRSSTAGKVLLFMAGLGLGAAGGSAGTSYMMKKSGNPPPKTANSAPAPVDSGRPAEMFKTLHAAKNNPEAVMPDAAELLDSALEQPATAEKIDMPDTEEKLARIIEEYKVSATAEDFKSRDPFMKIVMLENKASDDGKGGKMNWVSMPSIIKDDDILIAIRVDKPEYRNLLVFPGRMPISKVEDKNDPQIIYAYYHCINSDNTQNRGASVAVLDPVTELNKIPTKRFRTKTYLISKGFILPRCGK